RPHSGRWGWALPVITRMTVAAGLGHERRRSALAIAGGVAIIAAGIAAGHLVPGRQPAETAPSAPRLTILPPSGVHIPELPSQTALAISPDGQWIAFPGVSDGPNPGGGLYLRFIGELEPRRVGTGSNPFFSPDSKWLGFVDNDALQKIPVRGGDAQLICNV